MIFDRLENAARYAPIPELAEAMRLLSGSDLSALDEGTYPPEAGVRVLLQRYQTKPPTDVRLEAHARHIDVQVMLKGEEIVACRPQTAQDRAVDVDPARDVAFFAGTGDEVRLREGEFLVLFPGELHAPCIMTDAPRIVRKAVLKIQTDAALHAI